MYRRGLTKGRKAQEVEETPSETPLQELDTKFDPSDIRYTELGHETKERHEAWVPWNLELDGRSPPSEMEDGQRRVELS